MGNFQLEEERDCNEVMGAEDVQGSFNRERNECIVALKVYDQCRQQDCLTHSLIGPARAAETVCIGGETIHEGDIINPPNNAAAVTIERLRLKKVIIVEKEPNAFRPGYWDIDLKYVFVYRLVFREADGEVIGAPIKANSIFNKKVTLFGSIGTDLVISSDLFCRESETLDSDPFIFVEGKAVALAAELKYQRNRFEGMEDFSSQPNEVWVTIGLFTVIKLIRLVNLTVRSMGFCIPDECEDVSPLNPCEFFDSLEFPFEIFAPPQRREFVAGVTDARPITRKRCGCDD